jgi:hypothetical protein
MFTLTLETHGLETARDVLGALHKLGSSLRAVELNSVSREDSEATNAEILKWLVYTGRDFITASDQDADEIAKAFSAELERRLGAEFSEEAFWYKLNEREQQSGKKWNENERRENQEKLANELAAASLKEAMHKYMYQVSERIDYGRTNNPPFNKILNEQYEKWKKNVYGFAYPIGKATGQLIDNLNPDGLGSRNIRLKKS